MTLQKAIETLEIEDRRSYPKRRLEAHIAIKLGIEALKRIERLRDKAYNYRIPHLPGETEE